MNHQPSAHYSMDYCGGAIGAAGILSELLWPTGGTMIAGVGFAETDEDSVLDGVVGVTGIVVSTAGIGAPLSVE
ncbi:MAG TPA: hypothetical protein VLL06_06905, partial [Nitrospiraceae bacterium]|nr:hypothetical protein [Nitrospiraceae bacterium]